MVSAYSSNQTHYTVLVYYLPVDRGIPIAGSSEVFFQRLVKSKGCPRRSGPAVRFVEFLVTIDAEITLRVADMFSGTRGYAARAYYSYY